MNFFHAKNCELLLFSYVLCVQNGFLCLTKALFSCLNDFHCNNLSFTLTYSFNFWKAQCFILTHFCNHFRPDDLYYTDMSRHLTQENRQRMQPWLESRINSQDIEGLEWIDKEKKMFKVPWKHVGNREWSERDGIIFRVCILAFFVHSCIEQCIFCSD